MYRMEGTVLKSLTGSSLQRAETGKDLNFFRCIVERQVLINGMTRAPGDDAIERMEDSKQRCALKFSYSLRPHPRRETQGLAFAQ